MIPSFLHLTDEVSLLRSAHDSRPSEDELRRRRATLAESLSVTHSKSQEARADEAEARMEAEVARDRHREAKRRREEAATEEARRMDLLRRVNADAHAGAKWLRENKE